MVRGAMIDLATALMSLNERPSGQLLELGHLCSASTIRVGVQAKSVRHCVCADIELDLAVCLIKKFDKSVYSSTSAAS